MFHWLERYEEKQSLSDRIADRVAGFIGSWTFLAIQSVIFMIWVVANTIWLSGAYQFDPYPFILFNLFMSAEAAYSTPLIMMSQNRQADRDRVQADADYKTNIMAKEEIEALQEDLSRIENQKLDKIIRTLDMMHARM